MSTTSPALGALERALGKRPDAESRRGQQEMTAAIEHALATRTHLIVEAGTGTGKSLAYLVPALLSGKRILVATATKTLQDQLAKSELPFLADHLGVPVTWAVVKGRASYLCRAKLAERFDAAGNPLENELLPSDQTAEAAVVAGWAHRHESGDRDALPGPVSHAVWSQLSVSGMECPGASRCPHGDTCFAEKALDAAADATIVITNHHLLGLHISSGLRLLPPHDAVVVDEAHRLETSLSSAFGVDVGPGRLIALANNAARLIDPATPSDPVDDIRAAAEELTRVLGTAPTGRLDPAEGELGSAIAAGARAATAVTRSLKEAVDGDPELGAVRRVKAQGGHVAGDFDLALDLPDNHVAWTEPGRSVVRIAPVEIAGSLGAGLLVHQPVVLTSATLTVGGSTGPLARALGFLERSEGPDPVAVDVEDPVARTYTGLRIEGGFDYPRQGLLYTAAMLPEPRDPEWMEAAGDEAYELVEAAGGRALVLSTSHAMVRRLAERLAALPIRVIVQGEMPKRRLLAEFAEEESSVLVATMGYWEGIDVPGPSLSLVVLDRIPFSRPDDPLMQARREAVTRTGGSGFGDVDLPHAAMLLAQGAGRLIRSETDTGVVAVLDPRLTGRSYGRRILASLPRLRRTADREQALTYLRTIADAAGPDPDPAHPPSWSGTREDGRMRSP